jgi:hypothetical protein
MAALCCAARGDRSGCVLLPMSGDVLGYKPRNLGDLVGLERRDCNPYHLQFCTELAAQVDRTGAGQRSVLNAASRDLT